MRFQIATATKGLVATSNKILPSGSFYFTSALTNRTRFKCASRSSLRSAHESLGTTLPGIFHLLSSTATCASKSLPPPKGWWLRQINFYHSAVFTSISALTNRTRFKRASRSSLRSAHESLGTTLPGLFHPLHAAAPISSRSLPPPKGWWLRQIKFCHPAVFISLPRSRIAQGLNALPDPPCGPLTNRWAPHCQAYSISYPQPQHALPNRYRHQRVGGYDK